MARDKPFIIAQGVEYKIASEPVFSQVFLTIKNQKIGLVGPNGVGKSTFLKILLGQLTPSAGQIQVQGKIGYLKQEAILQKETIAEHWHVDTKLKALEHIETGQYHEQDFEIVGDDWDIKARLEQSLKKMGLSLQDIDRRINTFSGGQAMELLMQGILWTQPDFLFLDEPTNNLDTQRRNALYQLVREWHQGALIVSHDRALLEHVDQIAELRPDGLHLYGGNYEYYQHQKALESQSSQPKLRDAQKHLQKTQKGEQQRKEKLQKRAGSGKKLANSGSQPKIVLNKAKENSEKTQSKIADLADKRMMDAKQMLEQAKEDLQNHETLDFSMLMPGNYAQKGLVEIDKISFGYHPNELIIHDLSFQLKGHDRVSLQGPCGSGKTTLFKLLLGQLKPLSGTATVKAKHIAYLDQNASVLKKDMSLFDNFMAHNPGMSETDVRSRLAQFMFRRETVFKKVYQLGGGEQIRASLACILSNKEPPEVILMDEPTNHLDFMSIQNIVLALKDYPGAILITSHDTVFLQEMNISTFIDLTHN